MAKSVEVSAILTNFDILQWVNSLSTDKVISLIQFELELKQIICSKMRI
jgi:hypothetical protein